MSWIPDWTKTDSQRPDAAKAPNETDQLLELIPLGYVELTRGDLLKKKKKEVITDALRNFLHCLWWVWVCESGPNGAVDCFLGVFQDTENLRCSDDDSLWVCFFFQETQNPLFPVFRSAITLPKPNSLTVYFSSFCLSVIFIMLPIFYIRYCLYCLLMICNFFPPYFVDVVLIIWICHKSKSCFPPSGMTLQCLTE